MATALSELKRACQAVPAAPPVEMIKQGTSTWLKGRPANAPDGTVALALSDDAKVIINESDVRSVEKRGDDYAVEVSADSHFLLHIEKLFKATPNCGCKGDHESSTIARHETGPTKPILDIEIGPITVCDWVCGYVYLAGPPVYVCVAVNCRPAPK